MNSLASLAAIFSYKAIFSFYSFFKGIKSAGICVFLSRFKCSILFSDSWAKNNLSTKIPGKWTLSGWISPGSTISSTSAMEILHAGGKSALEFLAVLLNTKLPI